MTAIVLFIAVWSVVALSIILLVGRYLGRRPRSSSSLAAANPPAPREGDAHPGGEIRGTAASYPRSGAPKPLSLEQSAALRGRAWQEIAEAAEPGCSLSRNSAYESVGEILYAESQRGPIDNPVSAMNVADALLADGWHRIGEVQR